MTRLSELELTLAQRQDIQDPDPEIVEQWLDALTPKPASKTPQVVCPGIKPVKHQARPDPAKAKAIHLAESYIRNAGMYNPDEASLLDDLFGPSDASKNGPTTKPPRRMADLWRTQQPRAAHAEQDRQAAPHATAPARIPDEPDKPQVEVPS